MPQDILIEQAGAVRRIIIDRPKVRNACRGQTLSELDTALADAFDDETVRVIVLAGAGDKAFCVGADLKEMSGLHTPEMIVEAMGGWWQLLDRLRSAPKPIIAAVQGHAVGGGTEIALHCHIVISGESGRFGLPEIRRGHIPGAGGTVFLPRKIGRSAGAYYLLTGDDIPANEALHIGLIAKVVPDRDLRVEVEALAEHISSLAPAALRGIIRILAEGEDKTVDEAIALEREVCASIRGSAGFHEGIRAFVEKRNPVYENEADR